MYKIISITDKDGNTKEQILSDLLELHPQLTGDLVCLNALRSGVSEGLEPYCCFVWEDEPDRMMRTSKVSTMSEWNNKVEIETRNSVYIFEEIENESKFQ